MGEHSPNWVMSWLRVVLLVLHIFYGVLLAVVYPYLSQSGQRGILKTWSRQLLAIFDIGLQIEGSQPSCREGGCLIVANHVSWLDIFVLNAIHPSCFIAKSEVRGWPVIGWLCQRVGTTFIERGLRQNTTMINMRVGYMLGRNTSVALFPEGTTTDGKQVGHFYSALIQSAINSSARVYPIALRYQDDAGELSLSAAFTGETTLIESIWKILRNPHLNALVVHTPTLFPTIANRRELARTAQNAIAQALQCFGTNKQLDAPQEITLFSHTLVSFQSSYSLLIDPMLNHRPK